MPVTVVCDPDMEVEAHVILPRLYERQTLSSVKEAFLKKHQNSLPVSRLEQLFEPVARLWTMIGDYHPQGEQADTLFKTHKNINPLARSFLMGGCRPESRHSSSIYQAMISDINEEPTVRFADGAQFYDWVQRQPVDEDEKMALMRLYYEFDELRAYYATCLEAVIPLLRAAEVNFRPFVDETVKTARRLADEKDTQFLDKTGVILDGQTACTVYPLISQPDTLVLQADDDGNSCKIYLGYAVFELLDAKEAVRGLRAELSDFCKALTDPTKFSILQMLRGKNMYAGEIARALGLSGPTISHHMATITGLGLVRISKSGHRIYYERDEQTLERYLSNLNEALN